jgi:hypothetical protein
MECAAVGVAPQLAVVRQPRVGALDDPAQSEAQWALGVRAAGVRDHAALDAHVAESELGELGADLGVVVAPVEVQRLDVAEQTCCCDVLEGRPKELDVVAVGTVDGPANRDAVGVSGHRPLPAQLGAVNWAFAGPVPSAGCLVQRAIQGDLGEVKSDDAVIGAERFLAERIEHARGGPLVAPGSQRRVGDLVAENGFHAHPRASRHQPREDRPQTDPVRHPASVTAERDGSGQQQESSPPRQPRQHRTLRDREEGAPWLPTL